MLHFKEITDHNDFSGFVHEFTRSYLLHFYKNIDYFNIEVIAKDSTNDVSNRALELLKLIGESYEPQMVLAILTHGAGSFEKLSKEAEFEGSDWYDFLDTVSLTFITDIFRVISIPIKFACKLNKGEYPNGDLLSTKIQKMNRKYNLKIIKHFYDRNLFEISEDEVL